MRPATRDLVMSFVAMFVLIIVLAAADPRVRDRIGDLQPRTVSSHIARGTGEVQSAGVTMRDLVFDHGMMTIFVVAGTILVACMLRT